MTVIAVIGDLFKPSSPGQPIDGITALEILVVSLCVRSPDFCRIVIDGRYIVFHYVLRVTSSVAQPSTPA